MKGFRFKLQPILNVKELEENRLLEEYAQLKNAHEEMVNRLTTLQQTKESCLQQMQSEGEGSLDLEWVLIQRNYMNHLRREIILTTEEKHQRRQAMDQGFQRLVDKTKERKILDKLKEKHQAAFIANQLKTMQKELDDLAQGRFNHQKKHLEVER